MWQYCSELHLVVLIAIHNYTSQEQKSTDERLHLHSNVILYTYYTTNQHFIHTLFLLNFQIIFILKTNKEQHSQLCQSRKFFLQNQYWSARNIFLALYIIHLVNTTDWVMVSIVAAIQSNIALADLTNVYSIYYDFVNLLRILRRLCLQFTWTVCSLFNIIN